ncbi:MAG: hypothetical protein B6A08_08660 [Sorangiineae bacterium NIC37A_2]|jgi:hypothetical protein|nr:MAG: hypothetical protein B6A08_08660 [Sorangiineae bacterium NIC37A_2]
MIAALSALAILAPACQSYSSQLVRAQAFYQESRYEDALAIFRYLGPNEGALEPRQRVRYYYLRGMTDVRLGFKDDARYWLALARASLKSAASGLTPEEADRLELTLNDLNEDHRRTMRGYVETVEAQAMSCRWSSDCEDGYVCKANQCVSTDS